MGIRVKLFFERNHTRQYLTTIAICIGAVLPGGGSRANIAERELSPMTIAARSFVITDRQILAAFTFERVIAALTSGPVEQTTWLELLASAQTDASRPQIMTPMAGFIAARVDGYWRVAGMDNRAHLTPIAIVNRFDLAPADYAHCGEYRLIYSRRNDAATRLHIAIETVLPNPHPERGKGGCAGVAAFWRDLAGTEPVDDRRDRLERLFFDGLPGVTRLLDQQTFERGGRIRTSEIGDGRPKFRQFEMRRPCTTPQPCVARLVGVPLGNMPDAALFDANVANGRAVSFRREFLRQVAALSVPDVNRYSMNMDSGYLVSDVDGLVPSFNYQLPFRRSLRTPAGKEFREQIAAELRRAGSALTPEDIVGRAETQNCAGCHGKPGPVGGGLVFPKAFETGEHIADDSLVESARLSPALNDVFVPYRMHLLREYLRTTLQEDVE